MKEHYDSTMDQLHKLISEKALQKQSSMRNKRVDKDLHISMKKKLIQKKLSKAKKQLLEPKNVEQLIIQFPQSDNQNNPLTLQKRRKQNLMNKPSYDQCLVQPRVDRTQSEIIQQHKVAVIYKNYRINKKQEQVIELNKQNSIKIKNEILDTTQIRDDAPSIENMVGKKRRQLSPIFNVFEQLSSELVPLDEGQAHYIQKTIISFGDIKQIYNKSAMTGKLQMPRIQRQQVSVDQREIRPEKIDDW